MGGVCEEHFVQSLCYLTPAWGILGNRSNSPQMKNLSLLTKTYVAVFD